MKYLIIVSFLICSAAQSVEAKANRYIDSLMSAPSLVAYSDDGAADATVTEKPVPAVHAIINLGAKAIPLLIAHLDDARLTAATFGRNNIRVPVGHVCLDILTHIIKAPRILIADCADDGLGACIREGYYFQPDAFSHKGNKSIAPLEVSRVKRNWQRAYRRSYIKYQYPKWWKRRA
jgi:hypothetical protein